jgi:hypothetical protein
VRATRSSTRTSVSRPFQTNRRFRRAAQMYSGKYLRRCEPKPNRALNRRAADLPALELPRGIASAVVKMIKVSARRPIAPVELELHLHFVGRQWFKTDRTRPSVPRHAEQAVGTSRWQLPTPDRFPGFLAEKALVAHASENVNRVLVDWWVGRKTCATRGRRRRSCARQSGRCPLALQLPHWEAADVNVKPFESGYSGRRTRTGSRTRGGQIGHGLCDDHR